MTGRICRTPDEAFQAGFEEPCAHQVPDPEDCPKCRLTEAEIGRLVVLLRSDPATTAARTTAA